MLAETVTGEKHSEEASYYDEQDESQNDSVTKEEVKQSEESPV